MADKPRFLESRALIVAEMIIYGVILVVFLYYFLPLGLK